MGKLRKQNSNLPAFPRITPDKTETFAGKWTARVTKIFNQPDGSIIKATRKINKDGSIDTNNIFVLHLDPLRYQTIKNSGSFSCRLYMRVWRNWQTRRI